MLHLPESSAVRKDLPIVEGVLDYFPKAIAYVALVSKIGNEKHNPGEPLHWARGKSDDHMNCIGRHIIDRGQYAADGLIHDGNLAWRALANLELMLERLEASGHNIFELFGGHPPGQEAVARSPFSDARGNPVAHSPVGDFTGTVTINEHSHGDDHHAHPDPNTLGSHSG